MVTFHPRTLRKETSNQYSIQSNPQRSCASVRANRRRKLKISAARAYPPPFGGARPPHVSAHQKSRVRPAFGSLVRRLEGGLPDVQSWDPPHPSPRACSDDEGHYMSFPTMKGGMLFPRTDSCFTALSELKEEM